MKQKKTGTSASDVNINDVGNPGTHLKHRVVLELDDGEKISRARVADQLAIDRMLLADQINASQHRAAEYLLGVLLNAGVFVRTVNFTAIRSTSKSKDQYTHGLMRLRDITKVLSEEFSDRDVSLVYDVLIRDIDLIGADLAIFGACLDTVDAAMFSA